MERVEADGVEPGSSDGGEEMAMADGNDDVEGGEMEEDDDGLDGEGEVL